MQLALIVSILFVAGLAEAMAKKLSQNAQMPLFIDCDEDKECVGLNLGCSPFINNGKAACLGGYCNCPYYTKEQNEKAFGIEKNDSVANLYSCKNKYDCFRRKKMHCPPKVRICRSGACICPLHHEDWDWNNIKKEKKEMRLFMECEEHEECEDIDFGCSPFINHGKAGCWGGYCNCPYSTDAANDRAFGKDDGGFRLYSCDDDYDCYKRKRINCPPSQRVCKKHGSKTRGMCYCPVLGKSNTPILKSTLEWIVDKIQSLFL
ncbi:hypothetical protein O0L34_g242 [Tuta absoluta]|nr:hypothetical protein O0L34_g242 [Tuta absoluta]